MNNRSTSIIMILILVVLTLVMVSESWAMWHVVLHENFNRDPRRNTWPWRTPGDPYYDQDWANWGHNPANWPTADPNYTNCSWGLQNEIYNTQCTPDVDNQAAIWCAYATQRGPNAPQWPDEDEYWDNSNGWAWWGPFNLEDAVSGRMSFWYFLDVEAITNDSMSAVMVNNAGVLTSNGLDFRRGCGFGLSFLAPIDDWRMHTIYAESLRVNGQEVSFLGEEECYIAFVWQSDGRHHQGPGAFVDDVIVSWDDGLFDLRPSEMRYGYSAGEDSIIWNYQPPSLYQETRFEIAYKVEGRDDYTPPFTIECYVDDELFYEERVQRRQGDLDTTYYVATDEFWTADSGDHLVRWEIDAPVEDGGEIEESNEDNNYHYALIEVDWTPAPQFEILTPEEPVDVRLDEAFPIRWTVTDSNETDMYFDVFFFATTDSSGWSNDRQVIYEEPWRIIAIEVAAQEGENITMFTPSMPADSIGDRIYITGVASDGNPSNFTFDIAPGFIHVVDPRDVKDFLSAEPYQYNLEPVYPNPFNRMVSVAYTMPVAGDVRLTAYDLTGRQVATLVEGVKSAGRHIYAWHPESLAGGVYLLKLEAGGQSFMQKTIYMP